MQAKIVGEDGKARCIRALRCAMISAVKKFPKHLRGNHAELLRELRKVNLRAKNAPGRYARKNARLDAARTA